MSFRDYLLAHGAGDAAILAYLAQCGQRYGAGDRPALFDALAVCARFQAVIPDWAADAILQREQAVERGEVDTFGDLFGTPALSQRERKKETLIRENTRRVRALLIEHRCANGTWNAEEAFQPVADATGLSRRIVEAIYRRANLQGIAKGNPSGTFHEQAQIKIPLPRRRGRKLI